jgi:hypothetical protein
MTNFGKVAVLLTSKAKQEYGAQMASMIAETIAANKSKILSSLGSTPNGFIMVYACNGPHVARCSLPLPCRTDSHSSHSDPIPHFTIDAFGLDDNNHDKPIGVLHVYDDVNLTAFRAPRSKALEVRFPLEPCKDSEAPDSPYARPTSHCLDR